MVVDFLIIVVVVDVEVHIDGEDIRFVALANMRKEYHARPGMRHKARMNFLDRLHRKSGFCH